MFKFGECRHLEQFAQGLLYMNPLRYFIKQEADPVRGDPHEGTGHMAQAHGWLLRIKVGEDFKNVGTIEGAVRHQTPSGLNANLFCMYALRASAADTLVDPRNQAFGDTFAVLLQFDEFMRRVKAAVPSTTRQLQYGLVEYIDEGVYNGPMGIFRKDSRFAYQSEFRIALLPGVEIPYELRIGDLSDIVMIGPLCELNQRLRIGPVLHSLAEPQEATKTP
jgi:hypothetical protein